jgi:ubiquinone/menaquinone biosynthesis C-methylase UbiE
MASKLEQIKETWNNFSHDYVETMEQVTTLIYENILPLAKIESASKILEVGCGAGNGIRILCSIKPQNSSITACDISESMLSIAQSRNFPDTTFLLANNEDLPFQNNSYDRYIANLSLHIVENPIKMIEEAFRVLQPGGVALFSSVGKPRREDFRSFINQALITAGAPAKRSINLAISDDESLMKILKDAGFSRVLTFYSNACIPATTVDEVVEILGKNYSVENIKAINPELHKRVLETMREESAKIFESGQLITFDYLAAAAFRDA